MVMDMRGRYKRTKEHCRNLSRSKLKSVEVFERLQDRSLLEGLYIDEGLTINEIGEQLGCSHSVVYRQLKRFKISIRDKSEYECSKETREKIGKASKERWRDAEFRQKVVASMQGVKRSKETRRRMSEYRKRMIGNKSSNWKGGDVGYVCLVCGKNFSRKRRVVDYKYCSHGCAREGIDFTGENNPAWIDGRSFEPYCPKFDYEKKEEIRNLYGRVCVVSGVSALQNGQRLSVDHADENKQQGCDGILFKLIPLTHKVHGKMGNKQNHLLLELLLYGNKKAEMNYEFYE